MAIIWAITLAKLLFHIYFNNRYGYFRDEFDYISCGDHLGWGYVDQPPLIPFLIHINRAVLGDSLRSIRFIPALASSLLVVQTAVLAREFGGRGFALLLSAITVVIAPQYLSNGSLLGTNCLEPNLWMGCAYFAILAIKGSNPRYWLWFGVVAGLGMEEKYTIAIFGFGVVLGLLLTTQRRVFLNPWIWLGGLAAFLIFLPNLLWNVHYHWPFLELMRNIRAEGRDVILPFPRYFFEQTLLVHPFTTPIWLTGLFALLFSRRLKPYRFLGWCYLVCFTVLFVLHGKNYYLAPVYPMLLAAGAVIIGFAIDSSKRRSPKAHPRYAWLKPVIVIIFLADGIHLVPITVPVLSPDNFQSYTKTLALKLPVTEHSHAHAPLPQWYADQFGWEEIVAETAVTWNKLNPKPQRRKVRHLRSGLRPGRCDRLPRPQIRAAASAQWRPNLVSLGPARLFRQLHDRPGRPQRAPRRTLRSRRIRRHLRGQSLCRGKRNRSLHLPRPEIRHPGPTLATSKTLELNLRAHYPVFPCVKVFYPLSPQLDIPTRPPQQFISV